MLTPAFPSELACGDDPSALLCVRGSLPEAHPKALGTLSAAPLRPENHLYLPSRFCLLFHVVQRETGVLSNSG